MTSTTTGQALPVWPTVLEAFASVPANWQAMLRIFWTWIAILFGVGVLLLNLLPLPGDEYSAALLLPGLLLTGLLLVALGLLGFASTAVAWHRLLLLGEQPPPIYLDVGGRVLPYLGRLVLICLIVLAIELACSIVLYPFGMGLVLASSQVGSALFAALVSLPAIFVASRLSISLPGIAVERPMAFGEAWRITGSSALQLWGGTVLICLPSFVIGLAFDLSEGSRWAAVLFLAVNFLSAVAAISFLSLSYRFFAGAPRPTAPVTGPMPT
jgi:hypothetical protein